MRVISAGDGYQYLLKSVAAGDSDRVLSTPLTRYYAEAGAPPGRWMGRGVADLSGAPTAAASRDSDVLDSGNAGGGSHAAVHGSPRDSHGTATGTPQNPVTVGAAVTEEQLARLMGQGRDPVTEEPLGRAYPQYRSFDQRVEARVEAEVTEQMTGEQRTAAIEKIEAEEAERGQRRAVAGYDFTFSVPKSVSALWAVADAGVQEAIVQAHHDAVAEVIDLLEREVAVTRAGYPGPDGGAVAQAAVTGLVVTAFDHYDSRAGDPQLHTHAVISNKVKTVMDGRWRALDGRPMHAVVVGISEYYNTLLYDTLTERLGVGWEQRQRGRDRNPIWEITSVPEQLITEFSSRSTAIQAEHDRLIQEYIDTHGRRPSKAMVLRLRAQATLTTRPDKHTRPLSELTAEWRTRAAGVLGVEDATQWASEITHTATPTGTTAGMAGTVVDQATPVERDQTTPVGRDQEEIQAQPWVVEAGLVDGIPLRAGDLLEEDLQSLGVAVRDAVSEARSTWHYWNLWAEASRQLAGWRFATPQDREIATGAVVDRAMTASLRLTPDEVAPSPPAFRRVDGTSVFRPQHGEIYTSQELLEAEARLLGLARAADGPSVSREVVEAALASSGSGEVATTGEQARAVRTITSSGRVLDVLVGAAGAGKTATMAALRRAWDAEHGAGAVVGLAPSAAAAEVLAGDLGSGTSCENTAKWLWDYHHGRTQLRPGQLVILDEASLAGTRTLHAIADHAAAVGAKVLLVGDPMQLSAVDAGGSFGLLVRERRQDADAGGLAELTEVKRFTHRWERKASLSLRSGDTAVLDTYERHGRLQAGTTEDVVDSAYRAWRADNLAGKRSLMLAEDRDSVVQLNTRARLDRVAAGEVEADHAVTLHDGTDASVGDVVVTRRNDRRLHTRGPRGGWVKNGDRWTVDTLHDDGAVTLRRVTKRGRGPAATVTVPAGYVAEHLELGYASTVHRAQGMTVDTCHALVHSAQMTREAFYVAMTRGRHGNTAWVATDQAHLEEHQQTRDQQEVTVFTVLAGVLKHEGGETSAHEVMRTEQDRYTSITQLVAEYQTLAASAQYPRWAALIHASGLDQDDAQRVLTADGFGALAASLREAEADGHHPEQLLPGVVTGHKGLADANDPAAVLHYRLERISQPPPGQTKPQPRTGTQRTRRGRRIAGLIAPATGQEMEPQMRPAVEQRATLIEQRARTVLDTSLRNRDAWVKKLGPAPTDPQARHAWTEAAITVAAYQDLYGHDDAAPAPPQHTRLRDTARARAQQVASQATQPTGQRRGSRPSGPSL